MNADIAVAEPVLGLTLRRNLFLSDSIIVNKEVPGLDLYTYLERNNKYDKDLREKIIKKMASIWGKLVNNNFLHHDPWLGNFMLYIKQKDVQIKLIDIDNIYSVPFLSHRILLHTLARAKRKQICDFSNTNTKALSQVEINLFFEEFIKRCHRKLKIDELQEYVNLQIIKRFIKRNSKKLILEDDILYKYYQKRFKS